MTAKDERIAELEAELDELRREHHQFANQVTLQIVAMALAAEQARACAALWKEVAKGWRAVARGGD